MVPVTAVGRGDVGWLALTSSPVAVSTLLTVQDWLADNGSAANQAPHPREPSGPQVERVLSQALSRMPLETRVHLPEAYFFEV